MAKRLKLFRWTVAAVFTVFLCSGFRVYYKDHPWRSLSRTPASATKLFVIFEHATRELPNNLPSSDPLFGTTTITVEQAMASVLNDFNAIGAAYVTLVDDSDPDYNSTSANRRTIRIFNRSASGVSGGQAEFINEGGEVSSCEISLTTPMYDDAKTFIGVATHEIAHCLGLDHPQEITHSIMSYFNYDDVYRLQADDKMGLVYLYPIDESRGTESATLGLACSQK